VAWTPEAGFSQPIPDEPGGASPDAGAPDAGVLDAGVLDAGVLDASLDLLDRRVAPGAWHGGHAGESPSQRSRRPPGRSAEDDQGLPHGGLEDLLDQSLQPLLYPEDPMSRGGNRQVGGNGEQTPPLPARASDEELARMAALLVPAVEVPAFDASDPNLLDHLTEGLYERMRGRLRRELLDDRERAGLLTEFH